MSRLMLALALVGAFLAGGLLMNSTTSQADEPTDPKFRGTLYPKWKDLGLTKEQTQQIYKLQTEHRAQIDKLLAQIKKLRDAERTEAEKILTPAQKARLKELLTGVGEKDKASTDKPPDKDKKDGEIKKDAVKPTDK